MPQLANVSPKSTYSMSPISPILLQSDSEALEQARVALEAGQLVVAPTETSYGLLCRADNESALERLYLAKQRPAELVSAVFLSSVSEVKQWAKVPEIAGKLRDHFLPGPMTLVLPASSKAMSVLSETVINNQEIGIRVSSSEFISRLSALIPFPLTATSANISGTAAPTSAPEIRDQLGNDISLYVENGELSGAVSTVVRCFVEHSPEKCVEVLREGVISCAEIRAFLDEEFPGNDIEVKVS